jgi:hypothetical protein
MKPILLSNLRIEKLTIDNDYLGIIEKGNIIKDFLIGNKKQFNEIKMFSLYGDWGSGKSSLMKYLEHELKNDFNTFFYEAWEFEKDENLSMSLLEFITSKSSDSSEDLYEDVLKYGGRILRGMGKSIKLNIPLFPNGPAIELNPSAFIEEVSKKDELTFLEALDKFKSNFRRLEDKITREGMPQYNIIFIDDLDRCEPQQVLNLMSAIKLFFTYGQKTIFFCGIDKKAVEQAVKTKYGKVIKANEYLEKIFDISFSMPDHNDLLKLINHYFDETQYNFGENSIAINHRINNFFNALEFTNPRRVKKVLNKFQMFRSFSAVSNKSEIPNIDMKDGVARSFFETILILYLIIIHEFYTKEFNDFLNFEKKKDIYTKALKNPDSVSNLNQAILKNFSQKAFGSIYEEAKSNPLNNSFFQWLFYICLSPIKIQSLTLDVLLTKSAQQLVVTEKHIDFLFYKYVNNEEVSVLLESTTRNMTFSIAKGMVKNLL